MHPIFGQLRRLLLYLTSWIPLAALLAYLLSIAGELSRVESACLALPLCFLYAFVCLSAWYPCRVTPIDRTALSRLALTHVGGALICSGVWVIAAWILAWLLSSNVSEFRGLNARLDPELPLIFGTGILLYLLSVFFYYALIALEASQQAEARVLRRAFWRGKRN